MNYKELRKHLEVGFKLKQVKSSLKHLRPIRSILKITPIRITLQGTLRHSYLVASSVDKIDFDFPYFTITFKKKNILMPATVITYEIISEEIYKINIEKELALLNTPSAVF